MITELNPGDRLDHYRIEALVARGGMASVYRGTDLQTGLTVAIKVPHLEAECDPVFFERFRREAEIGQTFDHPGLLRVMTDDRSSRAYMAMEWVDAPSLRDILVRQGRLPPERSVRIALSICDVLDYIHNHGVVHRDLKPENIVVCADDWVKLIDFGIASKAGARRLTFGKLSRLMGTPEYVSPEQVKGGRGDARSDLYALGVILFEMFTGQTPFRGPDPLAVLNARLVSEPIPARQVAPDVSPQLEAIIHRALERDPRHRYARASEFARDLESPDDIAAPDHSGPVRAQTAPGRFLMYSALAIIPAMLFLLLFYVARHQ